MRIAILSWGSLIQTGVQRGLLIDGDWHIGGPILPLEFSRISQSGERAGCLTLVIDEQNGVNVPTHYALSSYTNLNNAIFNLRTVERITLIYSIGYVNITNNTEREFARRKHPIACNTIKAWAQTNCFDAVIWTGLLSNFEEKTGIPFSVETAVQYLSHLREPITSRAFEYIRNTPAEVITPLRRVVDDSLSVTPTPIRDEVPPPFSFHFRPL
jgi:hypothetical protein